MTMLDLSKLNANQRQAVEWGQGPLLVLAGPGSGKTQVLTMRVARLIQESRDDRFRILGLTFTTKAADEMRHRVDDFLGPAAQRARLTTFHSFCAEVLRQHGSHLGLRPDFEILAQDKDRIQVLDEAIHQASVHEMPRVDGEGMANLVEHLQREGFDGDETTPLPLPDKGRDWMRPIFRAYMEILLRENQLDYGALLLCCLRLFRERPRVARHYQVVYPYVCVDEYQDTNKAQDLVLRALCRGAEANLLVVADDDQILYQWNGASPERLRKLREDYGMPTIQLPESYRCPPAVIELANNLIRFNSERSPDKQDLIAASAPGADDPVRVRRFATHRQEMAWVAHDIVGRSLTADACTILARSSKLLQAAAEALREEGLSPYVTVRKNEFESAPLRFLHAACRLANAPLDHDELQALCGAFFELTECEITPDDAEVESSLHGGSLLRGFLGVSSGGGRGSQPKHPLMQHLEDQLAERLKYRDFARSVFEWCAQTRDQRGLDLEAAELEQGEVEVWNDISRSVRQHLGDDPSLSQFLQELDLRQKTSPPRKGDIQCLTIHMAKGREFQHVYLIGLAEDQLPSYFARQKGATSREIEEERRSCFVAITRVQQDLTLTFADAYFGYSKRPSRFLTEMGIDPGALQPVGHSRGVRL